MRYPGQVLGNAVHFACLRVTVSRNSLEYLGPCLLVPAAPVHAQASFDVERVRVHMCGFVVGAGATPAVVADVTLAIVGAFVLRVPAAMPPWPTFHFPHGQKSFAPLERHLGTRLPEP